MITFMAERIIEQRKISLEAGQKKYKSYFGTITLQKLYGKYQPEVDAILTTEGYEDCIVETPKLPTAE